MEPAALYPESAAAEQEDIPFPCKGCGEILEEGKAFELAGSRWHINCFRCSRCGTLLDSDAHLLLLGDGSLICSNCTYSCSSCGDKIEDTAILTGDKAYCSNCFRCRNCKMKIENLRYARTSQGIFCMDCHESLMQRRRKKKAAAAAASKKQPSGVKLDKSLPSLPPSAIESDPRPSFRDENGPTAAVAELPSHGKPAANQENILLPSNTHRSNRHSSIILQNSDADGNGEFLIPVAFDPSEEHRFTPIKSRTDSDPHSRDYFSRTRPTGTSLDHHHGLTSHSSDNRSPHIAYQEKGREWPQDNADGTNGVAGKTQQLADLVKSQDNFKAGRTPSARSSRSDLRSSFREDTTPFSATSPESNKSTSSQFKDVITTDSQRPGTRDDNAVSSRPSVDSARSLPLPNSSMQYLPKRGDSLESRLHQRPQGGDSSPQNVSSPSSGINGHASVPSRVRDDIHNEHLKRRARNDSLNALQGGAVLRSDPGQRSSMDEDTRVVGSDDSAGQNGESLLRRVSNSVRHSRSHSDKGARFANDTKWPRSPINGTQDISSPVSSPKSFESLREEITWLRNELQKERQRVTERDQRIAELHGMLNASADVKQADTELREKRSTMVVLDAQKEIVLRELGILTEHLESEKRSSGNTGALDLGRITNPVLREFAESIQRLKESYTPQIQELIQKRNDVAEELANVNRLKEKSFQEFEQLSSKNAQLAELNNQLVHQIQELYKVNSGAGAGGAIGLGICGHDKEKSVTSIDKPVLNDLGPSVSAANISEDVEPATIVPGPQVVSIRKGQPRKFNWKRGGQKAKGVTKGIKGFITSESKDILPYNSTAPAQESLPRTQTDPTRQGFGFFGNQRNKQGTTKMPVNDNPAASTDAAATNGLFGTDLEQRLEFEKGIIPAIVTRCIQEVELRGMDVEGIYRKSGASSVVQTIREGFEQNPDEYDISDPDLDIHAVTSALKQYFRKLPMPLITYAVYEKIIDSGEAPSDSARIEHLQRNLEELPRVHRDVLEFLIFHLKRVVEHEKENLMNSQNIAVVFAPTIMRPESLAREMTDVQKKNEVLKFLVENCQEVFMGMQS